MNCSLTAASIIPPDTLLVSLYLLLVTGVVWNEIRSFFSFGLNLTELIQPLGLWCESFITATPTCLYQSGLIGFNRAEHCPAGHYPNCLKAVFLSTWKVPVHSAFPVLWIWSGLSSVLLYIQLRPKTREINLWLVSLQVVDMHPEWPGGGGSEQVLWICPRPRMAVLLLLLQTPLSLRLHVRSHKALRACLGNGISALVSSCWKFDDANSK